MVSNIYCVVFLFACRRLVYPILPVSLDCLFSIEPVVYFLKQVVVMDFTNEGSNVNEGTSIDC